MQITIVPASTRVAAATIRHLLSSPSPPSIVGYYRDLARVPEEFQTSPNFTAKKGDIEDASSLDFSGSDAVLSITPMWYDGRDIVDVAKEVSWNVRNKIEETGGKGQIKRLVVLSSFGGQYTEGIGAILTNHVAEEILGGTNNIGEVVCVRPVYFMENWITAVDTIKAENYFFSTFTPSSFKLPHIAVKDIGETLAKELLSATPYPINGSSKPPVHPLEIHGPNYSTDDVQKIFEEVTGKNEIEVREIPKEGVQGFYEMVGLPPNVAEAFAEMNNSVLKGGMLNVNPEPTKDVRHVGKTELGELVREWWEKA
ncbi:hypothetical protein V8F20_001422 [Naviculisporaceae sp. PSN 640]